MKQPSSLEVLALAVYGDHDIDGNLLQLLKVRSDCVPELKGWVNMEDT